MLKWIKSKWLSILVLLLVIVTMLLNRGQMSAAWALLVDKTNIWILLLLIPVQAISYYATGGMMFSYLKSKGELKCVSQFSIARMCLEFNFVSHIAPGGDLVGFAYFNWLLGHKNVNSSRGTMAQIVRLVLSFAVFLIILVISVLYLMITNDINNTVIVISAILASLMIGGVTLLLATISSEKRIAIFSKRLTKTVNWIVRIVTLNKKLLMLDDLKVKNFLYEMHVEYELTVANKKILIRPLIWAICFNVMDVALIAITFMALGYWVNPAVLFVAMGITYLATAVSPTPGGAGFYEAAMIGFLASAGVPADMAIAGTLLSRVVLVSTTILSGYLFWQLTENEYSKQ